jgi:hypothetical protein
MHLEDVDSEQEYAIKPAKCSSAVRIEDGEAPIKINDQQVAPSQGAQGDMNLSKFMSRK